jgi:hypothetical protein
MLARKPQWYAPTVQLFACLSTVDPTAFLQGHVPVRRRGVRLISSIEVPQPLYLALEGCGLDAGQISSTVIRLRDAVHWFRISASGGVTELPFDGDTAAQMLRLKESPPDPTSGDDTTPANWGDLTPAERKRAKRLHSSTLGPDSLRVTPKGQLSKVDSAFVLYCTRVLREASGKNKFSFRRPMGGGPAARCGEP